MVNKYLILKSFDDAITKCTGYRVGTLSVGNNVKQTLNKFREKTKDYSYESMQMINNDGEIIHDTTDDDNHEETQVDFRNLNLDDLVTDNGSNLIITHNHPGAYWEYKGMLDREGFMSKKKVATVLSLGDVQQLFQTATDKNTGETVTPFKGIVAECPNGSRMSLVRKDDDPSAVLTDGHLDWSKESAFERTYEVLHNKWKHYVENYDDQFRAHMNRWAKDRVENPPSWWSDRDKKNEMHEKEKLSFSRKFNREHFTEHYLSDVITDFDRLGFELSIEWVE